MPRFLSLSAPALAAGALSAVLLAGCAAGPTPAPTNGAATPASTTADAPTAAGAAANDVDLSFARRMIPHHEQAIAMSDILLAKPGLNTELSDLATAIKAAQQPEIDQMRAWLQAQGEPEGLPGDARGDGMLTDAQLGELRSADTLAAAELYLDRMIAHHEGAVGLAEQELTGGTDPELLDLAQDIVTTQRERIGFLRELRVGF